MSGYNLRKRSSNKTNEQVTPSVFQSIQKERIAERRQIAKEKCEVGVKSIQGMWSKNGIHPTKTFPPEIWKMILNNLGPDQKGIMFNMHRMFEKLMEHTKIRDILFPKYIDSGAVNFNPIQERGRWMKISKFPFTTLRGVSKSIRESVDVFYENILLKFLRYEIIPDYVPSINLQLTLGDDIPRKTHEILKYFVERAAAPDTNEKLDFRIRTLEITIESADDAAANANFLAVSRFVNDVTCFLKQTGHNFWRFQLKCRGFEDLTDAKVLGELYKAFFMWLQLMPHLKWLDIKFWTLSDAVLPPIQEQEVELDGAIAPELKNLERLDLNLVTLRPDVLQISKEILRKNSHIKMFHFIALGADEEIFDPDFSSLVPLISQLPDLGCLYLEADIPIGICNLRKWLNFDWQLKKMILYLGLKYECINDVFRLLEEFPTLEEVTVTLSSLIVSPTNGNIDFLRLPHLNVFEMCPLETSRTFCSPMNFQIFLNLHFLLYCSNLRTIMWQRGFPNSTVGELVAKQEKNPPKGMIDFGDGRKDLCKSNIWDVFPRLEYIFVEYKEHRYGPIHDKIYCNRRLENYRLLYLYM